MIVLMISTGVALASHGEMKFNLLGFLIQASAVAVRIYYATCSILRACLFPWI